MKLSFQNPLSLNESTKKAIPAMDLMSPVPKLKKSLFVNTRKVSDSSDSVSVDKTPPEKHNYDNLKRRGKNNESGPVRCKFSNKEDGQETPLKLGNLKKSMKSNIRRMHGNSIDSRSLWMPQKKNVVYFNNITKKVRVANMQKNKVVPMSPLRIQNDPRNLGCFVNSIDSTLNATPLKHAPLIKSVSPGPHKRVDFGFKVPPMRMNSPLYSSVLSSNKLHKRG